MPSYQSAHTGAQIDTAVDTYQTQSQVQALINSAIETAIAQTKLAMYPIGSIYMSLESTDPATFIGGTWEQIEDTFLLAAGTNYSVGDTGGSEKHTHEFGVRLGGFYSSTTFENNSGTHGAISWDIDGNKTIPAYTHVSSPSTKCNGACAQSLSTYGISTYDLIGNTSYTSQLPPYLVVYVWKRIA